MSGCANVVAVVVACLVAGVVVVVVVVVVCHDVLVVVGMVSRCELSCVECCYGDMRLVVWMMGNSVRSDLVACICNTCYFVRVLFHWVVVVVGIGDMVVGIDVAVDVAVDVGLGGCCSDVVLCSVYTVVGLYATDVAVCNRNVLRCEVL